jgi:hypothetical protein
MTVELAPDTVRAGEVYLVIGDGLVSFVERKTAANPSPGPLTDWQITRISRGGTRCPRALGPCFHAYLHRHPDVMKDTLVTDIETGECDPRNDPAVRGTGGAVDGTSAFCKVLRVDVRPGRYLIVSGAQPIDGSAVLTVTP